MCITGRESRIARPHSKRSSGNALDNQVECGLLFWTSARLGSPFVLLSPRSLARPEELKYMLRVAGVGTLVATDDDQAAQLDEIAPEILRKVPIKIIVKCGRTTLPSSWISLAEVLATLLGIATLSTSQTRCTDTVLLLFTSGTTSTPKACPHSSRTLCLPSLAYRSLRHIDADKRSVQHLASHHVFGLTVTLAFWLAGASVVYPSKAFEPGSTLDAIEKQRCTHMAAVPSMRYGLRNHPSFSKRRLKSLISIDLEGAAIHPEILRTCLHPLQFGALSASTSFGMTESTISIAWDDTEIPPIQDDSVSVGRPTPGAKVKICAPGSRTPLKREELGELHLGGHQVINSYLCAEEGTLYEYLKDGGRWIATGDQAPVDIAGAVHVLGRLSVCQTGAKEAVFSSVEAGRSWPFWEDWAHGEQAPIVHLLDIAGPTLERVLNRIHKDRQERVSSFLRHVQEEQKQLTKYAHAPLYTIIARLEERERIPTDLDRGDGSILDAYFRRQCFNWLPNTKSGGDLGRLEQMQPGSSAALGLRWNCGSVSEETLFVHAMWDDAQLRLREVQGAMDVFIKAVQWLTAPENWDKRVGEFEGLMK